MSRTLQLIVFASGNGSNFEAIQKAIVEGKVDAKILAVISNKEKAYVHERAKKYGIPSFHFKNKDKVIYETEILNKLHEYDFDYIVCAGYMRVITSVLLRPYSGKILNIHPSDLPKYKGLHALEQALDAGEKEIGVSVHYIDETLDGGEIIKKVLFKIEDSWGIEKIEEVLHSHEHELYVSVLQSLGEEKRDEKSIIIG